MALNMMHNQGLNILNDDKNFSLIKNIVRAHPTTKQNLRSGLVNENYQTASNPARSREQPTDKFRQL